MEGENQKKNVRLGGQDDKMQASKHEEQKTIMTLGADPKKTKKRESLFFWRNDVPVLRGGRGGVGFQAKVRRGRMQNPDEGMVGRKEAFRPWRRWKAHVWPGKR